MRLKQLPLAIALFIVGALTPILFGQQIVPGSTPVQAWQPLYVCNQTATATGAANTAVTLTMTPPSGQYVYLCHVDISLVANAAVTGAAGPAPIFTTTNLPTNMVWWGTNETLGTGAMRPVIALPFGVVPLKTATAGTAFTIVTSAGQSTETVRINASAFYAQ
jgi:hypothetical protein